MRMRKKKNGDKRLAACADILAQCPHTPMTSPIHFGKDAPIWLEIGAGKGGFARAMAIRNPDVCYYAMERVSDCVVLAAEAALAEASLRPTDNLRFAVDNADRLADWFAPGSVERIFLNFSDPWPKKGWRKRRLTYRTFLALYFTLLAEGGTLCFKTDNVGLFDFTLEELTACDLTPDVVTHDLHNSAYDADNIRTEYEENFSAQGYPIHMLRVKKPIGYVAHFAADKKKTADNVSSKTE